MGARLRRARPEQEDVYRVGSDGAVSRVSRQEHNAWHRELGAVVDRLVSALATRDEATLSALVPDRTLRSRLPAGLAFDPACDAREQRAAATRVSVARRRRPPSVDADLPPAGRPVAADRRGPGATMTLPNA